MVSWYVAHVFSKCLIIIIIIIIIIKKGKEVKIQSLGIEISECGT